MFKDSEKYRNFLLRIKEQLNKLLPANYIWAFFRAIQQEQKIRREQICYEHLVQNLKFDIFNESLIKKISKYRLARRGICLSPHLKDNLQIVYASKTTNWEPHQIPSTLRNFSNVFGAKLLAFFHNVSCLTDDGCTFKMIKKNIVNQIVPHLNII